MGLRWQWSEQLGESRKVALRRFLTRPPPSIRLKTLAPITNPLLHLGSAVDNVKITHDNNPINGTTLDSVNILSTLWLTPLTPS
jgi:hypothetical protein